MQMSCKTPTSWTSHETMKSCYLRESSEFAKIRRFLTRLHDFMSNFNDRGDTPALVRHELCIQIQTGLLFLWHTLLHFLSCTCPAPSANQRLKSWSKKLWISICIHLLESLSKYSRIQGAAGTAYLFEWQNLYDVTIPHMESYVWLMRTID